MVVWENLECTHSMLRTEWLVPTNKLDFQCPHVEHVPNLALPSYQHQPNSNIQVINLSCIEIENHISWIEQLTLDNATTFL